MAPKSVNPLNVIINKTNGYTEESNGNKYLTLVPTYESKDNLKKYKDLWNKIKNPIKSKNNTQDDYNEKYMKIRFCSNVDLPLKTTLNLYDVIIVIRSVFQQILSTIFLEWLCVQISWIDIDVRVW